MELISLPLVLLLILNIQSEQTEGWTWWPTPSNPTGDTLPTLQYSETPPMTSLHEWTWWTTSPTTTEDTFTTLQYSGSPEMTTEDRPTFQVSVWPDDHVFRGETVNLTCVINGGGVRRWQYSWYKDYPTIQKNKRQYYTIRSVTESDAGKYTCKGTEIRGSRYSLISNAVTLTVSVLSVSPQQWLTEGDSVTLMCEVIKSSTGWTFSWFTVQNPSSDSIRGSKGIYTVSSVTVKHTGVYMCRAERGDPVYHTEYSNTQTLWITGVSPSVSLIIRPNRSQHFSSESLSLSCEDHSKSTGWTVRRYTDKLKPCSSSAYQSEPESTCTIRYLDTSDTGVYWCQSESGEKLHPVNISVHYVDVILDSPVHPVTEGDPLTLHCLYRLNPQTKFHKDKSVVQSQNKDNVMIIPSVSKSHEGFYYCEHTDRGESPESWISVREAQVKMSGLKIFIFLLAVCPYLIATAVLVIKFYRLKVTRSSVEDQLQYAVREDETSI
nr:B-cell receptor CD22-like [Misgurnus anguillicaudatus]